MIAIIYSGESGEVKYAEAASSDVIRGLDRQRGRSRYGTAKARESILGHEN
jgi:hypothetical protein